MTCGQNQRLVFVPPSSLAVSSFTTSSKRDVNAEIARNLDRTSSGAAPMRYVFLSSRCSGASSESTLPKSRLGASDL